MAAAGHQSRKLARALKQHEGWELIITSAANAPSRSKG
jgi:hypothetical protein